MPFPIENIQKLCDLRGETFRSLENKFGFSNSTIKRWKTAKKLPPYNRVKMISDYFGVSVAELSNGLYDENEDNKKTATDDGDGKTVVELDSISKDKEELKRLVDRLTPEEVRYYLASFHKTILG